MGNPPQRVGDLVFVKTRLRCPKCGRVVVLDPARFKGKSMMLLTDFLAHLECNETRNPADMLLIRYVVRHFCRSCFTKSGVRIRPNGWIKDWPRVGVGD